MQKTAKPTKWTGVLTTKGECEMRQNSGLAHCIYPDRHWDYCGNYQEMVEYIKINESEIKKELHLKLFKLIPNEEIKSVCLV